MREALGNYYKEKQEIPESLATAGAPEALPGGSVLTLDTDTMVVDVELPKAKGTLRMEPSATEEGIAWNCVAGDDLSQKALPVSCRK
ncbi:hypothetical protein M0765_007200 [Variovorax sp. S2]|nr:hypothetical protein [Variovorax sp. S12S4]MCR8957518.1 hypothetical protein [Variovorax sp. S12S4]